MAEIVFWQERASVLGALNEQLKQPAVWKIVDVVTKADTGIIQTYRETVDELIKYYMEADDNTRFLATLERHFMVSYLILVT